MLIQVKLGKLKLPNHVADFLFFFKLQIALQIGFLGLYIVKSTIPLTMVTQMQTSGPNAGYMTPKLALQFAFVFIS